MNDKIKAAMESYYFEKDGDVLENMIAFADRYGEWCRTDERALDQGAPDWEKWRDKADLLLKELVGE